MTRLLLSYLNEQKDSDNPAIISREGIVSYKSAIQYICNFGEQLYRYGCCEGNTIAVLIEDSPLLYYATFGTALIRSTFLGINTRYSITDIVQTIEKKKPDILLFSKSTYKSFGEQIVSRFPLIPIRIISMESLSDTVCTRLIENAATLQLDSEVVLFSSGSTQENKCIVHTHSNLIKTAERCIHAWRLTAKDRLLSGMHLLSAATIGCVTTAAIMLGIGIIIPDRKNPNKIKESIRKYKPTFFLGTPTHFLSLKNTIKSKKSSIKKASVAGTVCPVNLLRAYKTMPCKVYHHYGLTELLAVASVTDESWSETPSNSVGKPFKGVDIKIYNEMHQDFVPAGTIGEIYCQSQAQFKHYFFDSRQPDTVKGYFATGDLGYLDDQGYLFVLGRKNETINKGGNLIIPSDIEKAISFYCEQSVAIGYSDTKYGNKIVLVLEKKHKALFKSQKIKHLFSDKLATFKIPDKLYFIDQFPKTITGKISRHHVKEIVRGAFL